MDKIDLDAIITKVAPILNTPAENEDDEKDKQAVRDMVKDMLKEAIHQALVLASKKALLKEEYYIDPLPQERYIVDKQSILSVIDLVK